MFFTKKNHHFQSTFTFLQVKHLDCKIYGIYYTYFPVTHNHTIMEIYYLSLFQNQLISQTGILKTELALIILL